MTPVTAITYALLLVARHLFGGVGPQQRGVQLPRAVAARDVIVGAARCLGSVPHGLAAIDAKAVLGLREVQHFVLLLLTHARTLAHRGGQSVQVVQRGLSLRLAKSPVV